MKQRAIITGASSGIGRELARELARRGTDLGLTARRVDALESLAAEIRQECPGVQVVVRSLDVRDVEAIPVTFRGLAQELGGLDLVIANAGIGGPRSIGDGRFEQDRRLIETNLIGGMATVDTAVEMFRSAPAGGARRRIVGISSVASFRGLPGSAAYSASKAGFSTYLEATRAEVRSLGIEVITISPGYIDTPINQDMRSRPFLIDATDGARRIADLIDRGVLHSTVPVFPWTPIGWLMRSLPDGLWARIGATGMHRSGGR